MQQPDELCQAYDEVTESDEWKEQRQWVIQNYDPHLDGLVAHRMLEGARNYIRRHGVEHLAEVHQYQDFWKNKKIIKTMIGVILAAGMAKRLRPLTDERPKCLLTVGKRTLLERTFDAMTAAGINEFVVVTGYRGNMIRQFLTEHYAHVTIHFLDNADYANNNNIYSLWMTRDFVRGRDFLLMDSDILFDPQIVCRMLQEPDSALALNRHELGEERRHRKDECRLQRGLVPRAGRDD